MYKRPSNPKKKVFAPTVEGTVKKQLDESAIITGARRQAALIWDEFTETMKKLAFEKKLNAFDLPPHLNDLAARIDKEIKNERVKKATTELIDIKIRETFKYLEEFRLVLENTVNVIAHCPWKNKKDEYCNWTGRIRVDQKEFKLGICSLDCPDCGGDIGATSMTLPEEKE